MDFKKYALIFFVSSPAFAYWTCASYCQKYTTQNNYSANVIKSDGVTLSEAFIALNKLCPDGEKVGSHLTTGREFSSKTPAPTEACGKE